LGDTGVSFKKDRRFLTVAEMSEKLKSCTGTVVCRIGNSSVIAGAICYDIVANEKLHFGPYAVDPTVQGRGIGRTLLEHIYTLARQANCKCIEIEVVNHRSELLGMYGKMGYVEVGRQPFPFPERCTRPSWFVIMQKPL
jgi:GNAT superfamily N-acetyltransferase